MTGQQAGPGRPAYCPVGTAECYWTERFGLGLDEAAPEDFFEVDADLKTVAGEGMANPATRFHLWVFEARPDVNSIIHTHSPWASALAAEREPLVIPRWHITPLHDDCVSFGMQNYFMPKHRSESSTSIEEVQTSSTSSRVAGLRNCRHM